MVAPAIIAAGISAAASLGGAGLSMLNRGGSSTPDTSTFYQNWRNDDMAWSREQFNRNEAFQREAMNRSEALQREFAQNGIRWRIDDAKAAGLHPLAALGSSGASAAPIAVGGLGSTGGGGSYNVDFGRNSSGGGPDLGGLARDLGQNVSRAYLATRTPEEKILTAYELTRQAQQIQHGDLQNQYLASQIARMNQTSTGPGMPSQVSGVGVYEPKPPEVLNADPNATGQTAGPPTPANTWQRLPSGLLFSQPNKDLNIDEASSPGWATWMLENRVLPHFSKTHRDAARPSDKHLPPGATGWRLGPLGWRPTYPDIPESDRRGHLGRYDSDGYWVPNRR